MKFYLSLFTFKYKAGMQAKIDQESCDYDWFVSILTLQPEPRDPPVVGSADCRGSSFSFPVTVFSGCCLTVLCFLFQVPGESEKQWKPALVVLTEKDLLIYDSMPRRKEAWFSPVHSYPLLATR